MDSELGFRMVWCHAKGFEPEPSEFLNTLAQSEATSKSKFLEFQNFQAQGSQKSSLN